MKSSTKAAFLFFSALALVSLGDLAFSKKPGRTERNGWDRPDQMRGMRALPRPARERDFYDEGAPPEAKVTLGNLLFFDKILSGNKNISCATCHHPFGGTSDGLSLPVGEGGRGFSVARNTGTGAEAVPERVPRNAPHVFNLGAKEFTRMFHDGRVALDPSQASGFQSPAGDDLPSGLDNPLAVQAMFPVTSGTEMAGQDGENVIGTSAAAGILSGPGGVWDLLAQRLRDIPEYVTLFEAAFDDIDDAAGITYVHAANAIAAFEAVAWRADNSPFDHYLGGANDAMSGEALAGMRLFYGRAGCADCHSGTFQSDQEFHAVAMPQIGPGKGHGPSGHEDFGREAETEDPADRFKFRTPTLRNVELTGPWGHAGAYNSLEAVVRHHLDPVFHLEHYDPAHAVLPSRLDLDLIDFVVQRDPVLRSAIAAANELPSRAMSDQQVEDLIAFLRALTDPASIDLRIDVPRSVPSGLTVFD